MNLTLLAYGLFPLFAVLIVLLCVQRWEQQARRYNDRHRLGIASRTDEAYWHGALIYSNPADPDLLIPFRNGQGTTLNFGHPLVKQYLIALALIVTIVAVVTSLFGGSGPICHGPLCASSPN